MAVPHYPDVPESWQHPFGPYRQAPTEYGGEWWYVNPFTGLTPWDRFPPTDAKPLPDGFEDIFGPRPNSNDFHGEANPARAFQIARDLWEQDLEHFKQAGPPEWATEQMIKDTNAACQRWQMGEPLFYEGRYGFMARFPNAEFKFGFEAAAYETLQVTHHVIARWQIEAAGLGFETSEKHPFLPTHFE